MLFSTGNVLLYQLLMCRPFYACCLSKSHGKVIYEVTEVIIDLFKQKLLF